MGQNTWKRKSQTSTINQAQILSKAAVQVFTTPEPCAGQTPTSLGEAKEKKGITLLPPQEKETWNLEFRQFSCSENFNMDVGKNQCSSEEHNRIQSAQQVIFHNVQDTIQNYLTCEETEHMAYAQERRKLLRTDLEMTQMLG